MIALGWADVRSYALPVAGITMAFASVFVLLAIAGRSAGLLLLILSGLAISSLAGAATALVMNLSPIRSRRWRSLSGCWARWRIAVFAMSCCRCRSSSQ